MEWTLILVIIGAFLFYKFVIKYLIFTGRRRDGLINLPPQIKSMILNRDSKGLAQLLVQLELEGNDYLGGEIFKALDYPGGLGFATKVDKYRNKYRIEAGLPPLKKY